MIEKPDTLSDVDLRTEEVLKGKRLLLAPPGGVAFLGVNLLSLLGGAFLVAIVASGLLPRSDQFEGRGALMLGGAAFVVLLVSVTSFLVIRGFPKGHRVLVFISTAWTAIGAVAFAASAVGVRESSLVPSGVALVLLSLSTALARSERYRVYAAFMRRLRLRRLELLRKKKEGKRAVGLIS